MMFWCGLKLATRCIGSVVSWEGIQQDSNFTAACVWLGATCWKLQSDPELVADCAELGDTWECLYCELRCTTTSAGLGHFVLPQAGPLCGLAFERGSGWVCEPGDSSLRESPR